MKLYKVGVEQVYEATEHLVLDITDEPQLLHFNRAIDDLLIATPDGDIMIAWALDPNAEWDDGRCIPVFAADHLKEINNIKTSLLAIKAREPGATLKVYVTIQRN